MSLKENDIWDKNIKIKRVGESLGVCSCGGVIVVEQASCPEGRFGCLVMHYRDRCQKCGKFYSF